MTSYQSPPTSSRAGQVADGGVDADELRKTVGQEAALQGDRVAMLAVEGVEEARAVDRGRGLRSGELQERRVGVGELARRDRADVQDAEDGILDEQRHAEQRAHALHPQDRVEDVGVVDVGDVDRPASGRDASREAPAERDAHTALDLLLETLGRACHELAGVLVEEQDGDGVDTEDVLRAGQQLAEQGLQGQLGQRGIRQPVDVLELSRRALDGRLVADPEEHLALAWRRQR